MDGHRAVELPPDHCQHFVTTLADESNMLRMPALIPLVACGLPTCLEQGLGTIEGARAHPIDLRPFRDPLAAIEHRPGAEPPLGTLLQSHACR